MTDLKKLLRRAKDLPPMTKEQREEQSLCFAYGNLALSTNHRPKLDAFRYVAMGMGWTEEKFAEWAKNREWF